MQLLNDIHHLAFVTADLDRLTSFYRRVFDADVCVELQEEGVRHAFIELGPHTVLHPFQIPGVVSPGPEPRFGRGRLDHFGLNAASVPAFRELRRRVMGEGAGNGVVTDQGSLLAFSFTDPDGAEHEVIWVKPNVPIGAGLSRVLWTTAEMD